MTETWVIYCKESCNTMSTELARRKSEWAEWGKYDSLKEADRAYAIALTQRMPGIDYRLVHYVPHTLAMYAADEPGKA